jgi:hypothetical protein
VIGPLEPRDGYLSTVTSIAVHGDKSERTRYTERLSVRKLLYRVARSGRGIQLGSWRVNSPRRRIVAGAVVHALYQQMTGGGGG